MNNGTMGRVGVFLLIGLLVIPFAAASSNGIANSTAVNANFTAIVVNVTALQGNVVALQANITILNGYIGVGTNSLLNEILPTFNATITTVQNEQSAQALQIIGIQANQSKIAALASVDAAFRANESAIVNTSLRNNTDNINTLIANNTNSITTKINGILTPIEQNVSSATTYAEVAILLAIMSLALQFYWKWKGGKPQSNTLATQAPPSARLPFGGVKPPVAPATPMNKPARYTSETVTPFSKPSIIQKANKPVEAGTPEEEYMPEGLPDESPEDEEPEQPSSPRVIE